MLSLAKDKPSTRFSMKSFIYNFNEGNLQITDFSLSFYYWVHRAICFRDVYRNLWIWIYGDKISSQFYLKFLLDALSIGL